MTDALPPGPPGYEPVRSDVPWDPAYLALEPPERVVLLEELGEDAAGPTALSPVAITSPFRILSDDGVAAAQAICGELEEVATGDARIAKKTRGGVYRSRFLHGLSRDPTLIAFLRELAQAPLEPHPVGHHAVHLNYAPDDLARNVDQWHYDVVSFDYVMLVSDPRPMRGGRFEYFLGSVEEGKELLLGGGGLPPERVASPEFPGPGWAVLQQGHRVLHRAARLEEPYPRITLVGSFYTPHPEIPDPTELGTLLKIDGREIALVEWSRYSAVVAAGKLLRLAEGGAGFSQPLAELQASLRAAIAPVEQALADFERADEGGYAFFVPDGDESS